MLWLQFLLIVFVGVVKGDYREENLDKFCKSEIDDDHQYQEAPKNEDEPGKPLNVFGQLKVIDFNEIDGDHTDFHLHTYLKLIWKDPRLKRKDILTNDCSAYVWTPDVMFETAKSIQKHTKSDNVKTDFRIEPTGLVVMINRYSFQVECRMNFRNYPFDQQQCQFTICFGTRDDVAVLKWIDEMSSPRLPAIELSNNIYPIHYRLGQPLTLRITKRRTYGNYTCLLAYFPLVRRLTGPVLTTYIPTALVVTISWFPFWLKPDDAPARVTLSITSLLTLCTQVQQYKSYMPRVSYITAMDIWLFACICVVFSTLLEFVLCYKAHTDGKERENKRALEEIAQTKSMPSSEATEIKSWAEGGKDDYNLTRTHHAKASSMFERRLKSTTFKEKYLDKFCKEEINSYDENQDAPKNEDEPGQPLKVFVQFKVIDINEIDGDQMDFRLNTYFKLLWKDPRLKRKDILTNDCSSYVWTPDVMFETAKSIQSSDNAKTDFRIEPTGLIVMINRYAFKADCRMDFRNYPFDTQDCVFSICFGTTRDDVAVLKWMDDLSNPHPYFPIAFANIIEPLQYRLYHPKAYSITKQLTYGNYTYLYANFPLVRRLTGPILTTYIPTALVVAISWFPFWLKPDDAPARVSLSITSLLTLCTQVQQYKSYLPPVSYITAMDIWLFACIFSVFSTLLEFVLCYKAFTDGKERENKLALDEIAQTKSMSSSEATKIKSWAAGEKDTTNFRSRIRSIFASKQNKPCLCSFPQIDSVKMDIFCRTFFPLCFLAFTIIYTIYFLNVD